MRSTGISDSVRALVVTPGVAGSAALAELPGPSELVIDVRSVTAPAGIVCLTGVSSGGRALGREPGDIKVCLEVVAA